MIKIEDARWYYKTATAFDRREKYEVALKAFNRVILMAPTLPISYVKKGEVLYKLSKFQAAIEAFDRAIQLNALNRHDKAVEIFTTVIQLNPEYIDAYYQRGLAFKCLGNTKQR